MCSRSMPPLPLSTTPSTNYILVQPQMENLTPSAHQSFASLGTLDNSLPLHGDEGQTPTQHLIVEEEDALLLPLSERGRAGAGQKFPDANLGRCLPQEGSENIC